MYIDITSFFNSQAVYDVSGSIVTHGQNAGQITWGNALDASEAFDFVTTPEARKACIAYFDSFGVWDDLESWTNTELNALLLQYIAGDVQEIEGLCGNDDGSIDWSEVRRLAEDGTISGSIFQNEGESTIYFYMGH